MSAVGFWLTHTHTVAVVSINLLQIKEHFLFSFSFLPSLSVSPFLFITSPSPLSLPPYSRATSLGNQTLFLNTSFVVIRLKQLVELLSVCLWLHKNTIPLLDMKVQSFIFNVQKCLKTLFCSVFFWPLCGFVTTTDSSYINIIIWSVLDIKTLRVAALNMHPRFFIVLLKRVSPLWPQNFFNVWFPNSRRAEAWKLLVIITSRPNTFVSNLFQVKQLMENRRWTPRQS